LEEARKLSGLDKEEIGRLLEGERMRNVRHQAENELADSDLFK
jgi:hypothetical protein